MGSKGQADSTRKTPGDPDNKSPRHDDKKKLAPGVRPTHPGAAGKTGARMKALSLPALPPGQFRKSGVPPRQRPAGRQSR